ncbi:MAG TPA: sigma-70 family RNA polymerase sigma factor [Clostridiales bacterium]|nr:sigma-70 family RNA polymerase sigma factor [Clostridiales bacterium]
MPRRELSLDCLPQELPANIFDKNATNDVDLSRMKHFLHTAMYIELTEKQRYCLCERYLKGRKVKDIAADLNIDATGVSRHIKRALAVLQKRSRYLM